MTSVDIAVGHRVRLTSVFIAETVTLFPGMRENVAEFGDCVGVVAGPTFDGQPEYEWDVRWEPSGLRYAYRPEWLEIVDGVKCSV